MTLPSGITPKTLVVRAGLLFDGTVVGGIVTVSAPYDVTWLPTGETLLAAPMSKPLSGAEVAFELCPTNAVGLSRVNWTYTAQVNFAGVGKTVRKSFWLSEDAPSVVYLDLLTASDASDGTLIYVNALIRPPDGDPGDALTFVDANTVAWAPAVGITDHGDLFGLNHDDHPQYLTQSRGDARYPLISDVSSALAGKQPAGSYATTQQLSDGLGQKVNSSTYVAGLAAKANTSSLAPVATSGAYTDLTGRPTIPTTAQDVGAQPAGSYATPTDVSTTSTADRNRANHTGTQPANTVTGLAAVATSGAYVDLSGKPVIPSTPQEVGAQPVGSYATLDGAGKVPQAQIPAVAVTEFLGVTTSQAEMLTLVGQRGDWTTRTDRGTDWQLIAEPSSSLSSWRERTYPASPVSSVAGRVGAVTLSAPDVVGGVFADNQVPDTIARDTEVAAAVATRVPNSALGAASGAATLDSNGKLPKTQLTTISSTDVSDSTSIGRSLLTAPSAASALTTLGTAPILVLAAGAAVPANTPAGTIIFRS